MCNNTGEYKFGKSVHRLKKFWGAWKVSCIVISKIRGGGEKE
jgi:hypothetical protein